ncbi:MAG TPA: neutral/alkaline non-lysosomal ceramidase N-terminal domain-containing protein [Verrucomicrobiae bacterium]
MGAKLLQLVSLLVFCLAGSVAGDELRQVGVARIDITPDYPVRLAGYAVRKTESEGVAQHLYAKALAFGSDKEKPAILITVDNCGVPVNVRDEVVRRLRAGAHLKAERITICSTHTHSAPWLKGYLRNLFGVELPPEQATRLERYTRELTDALERVALDALAARRPARLTHGLGHAGFAANRRTQGGPADQDVPVLVIANPDGKVRAVFASYACHCTTLTGEFNQVCGDWAGYAAEYLERDQPGAIALIALGCGGDANPNPRPGFDLAKRHGAEIAGSVAALLTNRLAAVEGKLVCRTKAIGLAFDTLPARAEWEARARETNYTGSHARLQLARLDRGENLPTQSPYLVQSWTFGKDLALVFLPGEVVVDYSLRLKREFDPARIWVNAYANDVPCYIPSERVLKEGGYEGGGAMIYYDLPTRFAPGLETKIDAAVQRLVPRAFARPLTPTFR